MQLLSPRMRHWLDQMLHTHDTPERTAAAFALGVFFGFSPLLGFHTVLGLVFAFALSLNRVAVLLGIYSNLPWILPAYYTLATAAGAAVLRVPIKPRLLKELTAALADGSWTDFRLLAHALTPLAWAYVLGSTVGAILLSLIAYRVSLTMIVAHRRRTEHIVSD
ncbi:MAG TPA: DUF2062 domain-containing protein [Vicinamibacterales bacterium]|jgi:hypothetical protein